LRPCCCCSWRIIVCRSSWYLGRGFIV
jgi:hypothetical protein